MPAAALRIPRAPAALQRGLIQAALALAIAAVAAGSTWFADEWGTRRGLAMGALLVVLVWLASTRRTLVALAAFMLYIGLLDGYAKLSTGSTSVTLVRDVMLFAIVAGVLVRAQATGRRLEPPPLSGWVVAFAVLVLVQLANPRNGTFLHSLGGIRQHLEFVPLFFLTFWFVRSRQALRGFVILLLVIGAANGVATYAQFNLTAEEFAAWGPGYAQRVLGEGLFSESGRTFAATDDIDRVRPFGLGSDAGAGGMMAAYALGALLALAVRAKRFRHILLVVAAALAVVTGILASQGRGVVVSAVAVVLGYGVLTISAGRRVAGIAGLVVVAALAVFVVQGLVGSSGPGAVDDTFRYEGLASSRILETTREARGNSIAAIPENIVTYPLGAGLGVAGPASGQAGGTELTGELDAETWFSFMTLEAGVPAMLVVAGFTLTLLVLAVRRVREEPDHETRILLSAIVAPIAALLAFYWVGGGLTATTPYAPYLWGVGGIVAYWLVARPAERAGAGRR